MDEIYKNIYQVKSVEIIELYYPNSNYNYL